MLTRIEIRNFQSLKKVDLDLGEFTVIVGPSSSGKSALMRACRALASNVRGNAVITRGQRHAMITAYTDNHAVTLERSDTSGTYRLMSPGAAELTFTKLNGGVPAQITSALRIEPVPTNGTSVNFASQFDRPYLLDDSGANVARVLGELTNVNAIFEAVRAANKVRLNAASTLKTRRRDLESLKARLMQYQGLADRLSALENAEQLAALGGDRAKRIERLERALKTLQLAEAALDKASKLPSVPSPDIMNMVLNRLRDLTAALTKLAGRIRRLEAAQAELDEAYWVEERTNLELGEALRALGACPTCGRPV